MPASSSWLTSQKYGYDFVVATTQTAINATMLTFLSTRKEPVVNICYVAGTDSKGTPELITWEDLLKRTGNTDPFKIPASANALTDPRIIKLMAARFMTGFRVRLGIPPMDDPTKVPDVVTLGDSSTTITFRMLCSEFTVVEYTPPGGWTQASWTSVSQTRNNPWVFKATVNLSLSAVGEGTWSSLPPNIQKTIKNLSGTSFSVQQLLFDLANARLQGSGPEIPGVAENSKANSALANSLLKNYFRTMVKDGQPLLGCAVVKHTDSKSTMTLTDMDIQVSPMVDPQGVKFSNPNEIQQDLATLNYLCAADGAALPTASQFNWNWVDQPDINDHDGVLSINRNTFRNWYHRQLKDYVGKVCLKPWVYVGKVGATSVEYKYSFAAGQAPEVTQNPGGSEVLKYHYVSADESYTDRAGTEAGRMKLETTFDMTVNFSGNQIIVWQSLRIYLYLKALATSNHANIFNKVITDTFTLGINNDPKSGGQIVANKTTDVKDYSGDVDTNAFENFWTGFNDLGAEIKRQASPFASQAFASIPLNIVNQYVFPGGQTFAFKKVGFSNYQDLTAQISYLDPSQPIVVVPGPVISPTASASSKNILPLPRMVASLDRAPKFKA